MNDKFSTRLAPFLEDLRAYCRKLAVSVWDADDLLQETLARVYRAYKMQPERQLNKTYLKRIAKNAWIDQWRKTRELHFLSEDEVSIYENGTSPALQENSATPNQAAFANSPDKQLAIREAFEALADRLSARQMVLILMMDVFAFTAKETAELLFMTEGAVKEAVKRARRRLNLLANQSQEDVAVTKKIENNRTGAYPHASHSSNEFIIAPPASDARLSAPPIEAFLKAFRAGNPRSICGAYLALTEKGVHVVQAQRLADRLYFLFRDPDGHLIGLFSEISR